MTPEGEARGEVRLVAMSEADFILLRDGHTLSVAGDSLQDAWDNGLTEQEAKMLTRNSIDRGVPADHTALQKLWLAFQDELPNPEEES